MEGVVSSRLAKSRSVRRIYRALSWISLIIVIYVALLFLLPVKQATLNAYGFSAFEYRLIRFAVVVPLLLVWLAAFAGYSTLKQYAHSLQKSDEAEHFSRLAKGGAWLAWSLPISAYMALISASLAVKWPSLQSATVIVNNYINLLFPLVAFSLIGLASRGLLNQAKLKLSQISVAVITTFFLIAGALYCYLIFHHFVGNGLGSSQNPYYLPFWLVIVTVIAPYLYIWFVGLLAAYEITLYSRQINGILYRRSLQLLAGGLSIIILSSIALQYFNGIIPRNGTLILNGRLLTSVILRIIAGSGFMLLTVGALRLKRIEEV